MVGDDDIDVIVAELMSRPHVTLDPNCVENAPGTRTRRSGQRRPRMNKTRAMIARMIRMVHNISTPPRFIHVRL
jgi:hypothetical protein